jgi:regulator of ribosome biosynthesis
MSASYQVDPGNLCITETSYVSGPRRDEDELADEAKRAVRTLFGELYALPTELKKYDPNEAAVEVFQLPQPIMRLPREKAPPKEKPLTPWQKFALKKGIALSRKRDNKKWDDERQEFVDRWGKRARQRDREDDWLREVKPGHVMEEVDGDPFLEARRRKQTQLSKAAKNAERNRKRNEANHNEMRDLDRTLRTVATASMGKFDQAAQKRKKH